LGRIRLSLSVIPWITFTDASGEVDASGDYGGGTRIEGRAVACRASGGSLFAGGFEAVVGEGISSVCPSSRLWAGFLAAFRRKAAGSGGAVSAGFQPLDRRLTLRAILRCRCAAGDA
jgi:hypothetical protein